MKIHVLSGWDWELRHCWLGYFKLPVIQSYGPNGRVITILGVSFFIFTQGD